MGKQRGAGAGRNIVAAIDKVKRMQMKKNKGLSMSTMHGAGGVGGLDRDVIFKMLNTTMPKVRENMRTQILNAAKNQQNLQGRDIFAGPSMTVRSILGPNMAAKAGILAATASIGSVLAGLGLYKYKKRKSKK